MPLTLECMDIILTDIQARRAQRMARQERSTLRFARRMPVSEGAICPPALLEQVVRPVLESLDIVHANEPIHLRVFGVGRKTRCVDLQLHRTTVHMPPNSFDCVVPTDAEVGLTLKEADVRIFVDGPCLCVLDLIQENLAKTSKGQLSRRIHPFAQSLALASEFCGTYARDPHSPRHGRPRYEAPPVLTIDELKEFSDNVGRANGASVLRDIVMCLAEQLASPMETLVYALAVARTCLGGLNLPKPAVNQPLSLSSNERKTISLSQITPDLYWDAYKEAVEYDGEDHNTEEGIKKDKRRIVGYQTLGITVFPATKDDFKDTAAADAFMRSVTRHMEKHEGKAFKRRMERLFNSDTHRTRREMLRKAVQSCP